MSEIRERLIKTLDFIGLKNPALEKHTGIKANDWSALRNRRVRANEDHINAVVNLKPEFAYWIVSGNIAPEIEQISPETEEIRVRLKTGSQ